MWKIIIISAILSSIASIAQAQTAPQCNERKSVLKLLENKYKESPVAFGVTSNGGLVEVLKSGTTSTSDTWTIIITTSKGVSCLVAAGEGWKAIEQIALDPET